MSGSATVTLADGVGVRDLRGLVSPGCLLGPNWRLLGDRFQGFQTSRWDWRSDMVSLVLIFSLSPFFRPHTLYLLDFFLPRHLSVALLSRPCSLFRLDLWSVYSWVFRFLPNGKIDLTVGWHGPMAGMAPTEVVVGCLGLHVRVWLLFHIFFISSHS